MKKYIFGAALLLAVCVSPVLVQAQTGLTSSQMSAILGLLQAFGADQSVINNVQVALNGGTPTQTATALTITTTSLPSGTVGTPYSASIEGSGGVSSYSWSVTGKPAGISTITAQIQCFRAPCVNQTPVTISGTPTKVGTYTLSIVLKSGTKTVSKKLTLVIVAKSTALSIITDSLQNGVSGNQYAASITGSGGNGSYTWSVAGLPSGLNAVSAMCAFAGSSNQACSASAQIQISGTPTAVGTSTIVATLTSGTQTINKSFTLVVAPSSVTPNVACNNGATNPPTCSINTCQNRWWIDSTHSTCSLQQFCGAYMYYGLQTFDSQSACQVAAPVATTTAPLITTISLPNGTVGASYSASIAGSGGIGSYSWSATGLPAGLGLIVPSIACAAGSYGASFAPCINQLPAVIGGTPTTAGTYTINVNIQTGDKSDWKNVFKIFNVTIADSVHTLPFCAQPPMPTCPDGMACAQVMPAAKTYTSNDTINSDKATYLYAGNCK